VEAAGGRGHARLGLLGQLTGEVVVIGAGLAGLTAATFLERAGVDVLVVERADAPGGYARPIRGDGVSADLAASELPTGVEGELVDGIFAHIGVRDRCSFEPGVGSHRVVLDELELDVPTEPLDAYADALAGRFPPEADGIGRFAALSEQILEDVHAMPLHVSLDRLDELAARFPVYFRYAGATLADVLEELIRDPVARSTLAATWPQTGASPERVSFATFAQGVALYARGTVRPRGGLASVVDALAAQLGGRLRLGTQVTRIVLEEGSVAGVELDGGERVSAPVAIAAGDARAALTELLEPGALPARLARRLDRMQPSLSACVVVAEAAADPGGRPPVFLHDGGRARWISAGEGTLVARALAAPEDDVDRLVGELTDDLLRVASGTRVVAALAPADLERLTANTRGAAFGWENSPQQTGGRRLPLVTPVDGLFLAGHWAQPGHGVYRAILSGMHAARAVMARSGNADAIPEFRARGG
jgi:phytoene dehydrogenase-like protein